MLTAWQALFHKSFWCGVSSFSVTEEIMVIADGRDKITAAQGNPHAVAKYIPRKKAHFNLVFCVFFCIIGSAVRIDAILTRFGYCSRREATHWIRGGRCRVGDRVLKSGSEKVAPEEVTIDGKPIEFPNGLYVALCKPTGYTCSHNEDGPLVFELLPPSWMRRNPVVSTVGRLDKETSGLILISDDGDFIHRMTSPRHHVSKTYSFVTSAPVPSEAVALFASGEMMLEGEKKPLLPAELDMQSECCGTLVLHEGRYHQVRRMLASVGAPVLSLRRIAIGTLSLKAMPLSEGEWQPVNPTLFD